MRLDRTKFIDWLKAKPPTEIVGQNRDCHSCPVAQFYYEASGCDVVIFDDGDGYVIDRGYNKRRLPGWAADFALSVDSDAYGRITAGRALEVLAAR